MDTVLPAIENDSGRERIRVHFCDGIRGLAALYVVLYHSVNIPREFPTLGHRIGRWFGWMDHGYAAVSIFIVLSGFCLMLPVIRTNPIQIQGGLGKYLYRRARRILPPYYAALILCLLLLAGLRVISSRGSAGGAEGNVFTPGIVISHAFLVHNLMDGWSGRINSPMWSVATEWHIYFLFPLVLLPVWRRLGATFTIAAGLAVGYIPHFFFPKPYSLDSARFWYAGLFAMGMASAYVSFSTKPNVRAARDKMQWGAAFLILAAASVILAISAQGQYEKFFWVLEPLIGSAAGAFLVWCAMASSSGEAPLVLRALESRACVSLGLFSYSLYLTHQPIHIAMLRVSEKLHLSAAAKLGFMAIVYIPLAIAAAYVFHLAFEKRFMPPNAAPQPEGNVAPPAPQNELAAVHTITTPSSE